MASAQSFPQPKLFRLEPDARGDTVEALCRRIGQYCEQTGARSVMVRVDGAVKASRHELLGAIASLADSGCPEGFKLAWIAPHREAFEALIPTQYPDKRSGIHSRVFVEEFGAKTWVGW